MWREEENSSHYIIMLRTKRYLCASGLRTSVQEVGGGGGGQDSLRHMVDSKKSLSTTDTREQDKVCCLPCMHLASVGAN